MNQTKSNPLPWSLPLGRVWGIPVYLHATFILLLGFLAVSHGLVGGSWGAALASFAFFGGIFGCVLLHEFGHALAARRYGIHTKDITLLPIGGIARLERMPEQPRHELVVALAGPAVNVVIAAGLALGLWLGGGWQPLHTLSTTSGNLLERLLVANIFLVAFNLIPAFPMDGGRVLRSLLAMRLGATRATQIAAGIGKGFAVAFGFVGLFINPVLLLISLFVWIGAAQEARAVEMKSTFAGIPVREAMLTQFETLSPRHTLEEATRVLLAGSQQDFPVVERGQLVGLLPREQLIGGLQKHPPQELVASVMERQFQVARPDDLLDDVLGQAQPERPAAIPVLHNGRIAGLLTPDNIGELYMITAALRGRITLSQSAPPLLSVARIEDVPVYSRPMASPLHD